MFAFLSIPFKNQSRKESVLIKVAKSPAKSPAKSQHWRNPTTTFYKTYSLVAIWIHCVKWLRAKEPHRKAAETGKTVRT
jgi:hypothetical protein